MKKQMAMEAVFYRKCVARHCNFVNPNICVHPIKLYGVSAGSADRSHYTNRIGSDSHKWLDVMPFVASTQMDGNPVSVNILFPTNFDRPMIYEGQHLQQYLTVRPTTANDAPILDPNNCGQ